MTTSYEIVSTDPRTKRETVIAHATGESQATDVAEALQAKMIDLGSRKIITTRPAATSDESPAA